MGRQDCQRCKQPYTWTKEAYGRCPDCHVVILRERLTARVVGFDRLMLILGATALMVLIYPSL